MTDRQARLLPLVLTAAIAFFDLAPPAGAQMASPDSPARFPAAPPPGAPVPESAPRIIPPEAFEEPVAPLKTVAPVPAPAPQAAAPVPTPAPRLIPPAATPPATGKTEPPTPPVAGQPMPPEEVACRASLRSMGVEFEERPPVSEPAGCIMAHPIAVTTLSGEVALEPAAVMNCAMAEAAARFTRDVIAPAAQTIFASRLASVRQGSAYVCRPRNGTSKLSEHAFGNALDFGAFTLADGRVTTVGSTGDEKEQKFLTRLRRAACGPFTTVLGPGSDADHATHFHFDLQPRRNSSTWCE